MNLTKTRALLTRFQDIPRSTISDPTFMEITSYPHLENVSSNILSFYLDPEREHGLDNLMLEALLAAVGQPVGDEDLSNVVITREAVTASDNRLDLLVTTDNLVIGIENKIYHQVHNDLRDYLAYLDSQAQGRKVIPILLSLFPVGGVVDLVTFQPLLYETLFGQLLDRLGAYVLEANHRYLLYLTDFVTTLRNLRKGTQMDKAFIEFIAANEQEVMSLFSEISRLKDEMRSRLNDLRERIRVTNEETGIALQQWVYRHPSQILDILGNRLIELDDMPLTVMAIVHPLGWTVELKLEDKWGGPVRLKQWLNDKDIPIHPNPNNQEHLVYGQRFPYEVNLSVIQTEVNNLIEKIRAAYHSSV